MAVDAVASVILQKLKDLLSEDSFTNNTLIGYQLEEMQKALQKMRGVFIDALDTDSNVEDIKKWTDDYLRHPYDADYSIESFALRITRQRKRLGSLMNHALFLKKFTACKMLSRKLEKIQRKIQELNVRTPAVLEDASRRSIVEEMKQNSISLVDPETDNFGSSMRRSISTSAVSITEGSPRSLLQSKSFKMPSTSTFRERWQHSKLMYSYSYDEETLSIVGSKRLVPELLNRLTNEDGSGDRIISVFGELGSSKTMLARAVYGNRIIKNQFKGVCAWVTIFKESTTEDSLLNLLKQWEKSKEQKMV